MEEKNTISEIIQKNFTAKISYYSKYNNNVKIFENKNFIMVDSGMPSDTFNICVIKSKDFLENAETLTESAGYFSEKAYPAAIWIWGGTDYNILKKMPEYGFELSEKETGMYAEISKIKLKKYKNKDFVIKKVSSDEDMEGFSEVLGSIFGDSEEAVYVKKQYDVLRKAGIYNGSDMTFYVALYNGEPVSCGTVFITTESAGIYDVATKEEYRKKGFGSAIFNYLLGIAKESGLEYCILQASADGAGIYKKMGFLEACNINIYENRDFLEKRDQGDKQHYVYIVKCSDQTYYTGYTNDLEKRLLAHNSGKGAKYTRNRIPVEIVYFEEYKEKSEAMKREYAIKQLTREQKEKLIKAKN